MRLFMTQHFWCLQPLRQHRGIRDCRRGQSVPSCYSPPFLAARQRTWNECITVVSLEVKKPVALRYCFKNFQLGNMANAGGLPLFPFRTDNW